MGLPIPASAVLSRPRSAALTLRTMTTTHRDKIVLITGANKGVGLATAHHLARAGHTVLLGARDPERGTTAAETLAGEGLGVRYVPLDVTKPGTISAAAGLIAGDYGRLDILVNNAAISRDRVTMRDGRYHPEELPVPALREVYEANVLGVVAVTNAMVPLLRKAPAPFVGMVSSGLGTVALLTEPPEWMEPYTRLLAYNSSKAAMNAVTLVYARALREYGIRVNALSPGFCATDLNNNEGHRPADAGGADIARQVTPPDDDTRTGMFLAEDGGTYPW
jgi:NAD(P)-dependent dehydrogenase (short-subunit alcohol dehydrogenase family)